MGTRRLWIAAFTPILIGLLAAGVFGHRVFLLVFVIWLGALACVLRADALNVRARGQQQPSAACSGLGRGGCSPRWC
ncbi:hypothetical protein GCM10022267_65110 [Lentzea roselyniae]|uniref:Uncharacterized protein n=1 Tax=Lentzea roselyniae TaxID=531940 RepID=A0ABP7BVA2_9PSEU